MLLTRLPKVGSNRIWLFELYSLYDAGLLYFDQMEIVSKYNTVLAYCTDSHEGALAASILC